MEGKERKKEERKEGTKKGIVKRWKKEMNDGLKETGGMKDAQKKGINEKSKKHLRNSGRKE